MYFASPLTHLLGLYISFHVWVRQNCILRNFEIPDSFVGERLPTQTFDLVVIRYHIHLSYYLMKVIDPKYFQKEQKYA